jgi:hypothetical protein
VRSVADRLRDADRSRVAALSPEERVALSLRLASAAADVLCAARGLTRPEAAALARRVRAQGRRPSRSASGWRHVRGARRDRPPAAVEGVPHALIGTAATAGLGVVRASDDLDLVVTEGAVLAESFRAPLARAGIAADAGLILAAGGRDAVPAEVESRVAALPPESLALWRALASERA